MYYIIYAYFYILAFKRFQKNLQVISIVKLLEKQEDCACEEQKLKTQRSQSKIFSMNKK